MAQWRPRGAILWAGTGTTMKMWSSKPEAFMRAQNRGGGLLPVNLAVALFGLAGVLGKLSDLPPPGIVLGRVFFSGLALLALVFVLRTSLRMRSRDVPLLVGQGAVLALHWTLFFQSIAVSSVAVGLLSFSTFPLFTAAVEPLLIGTRPDRSQFVAAVCIMAGIAVLVPSVSLDNSTTQGVLWGLGAAASFALLAVLNRRLGQTYSSLLISAFQHCTAAVLLLPLLLVMPLSALADGRRLLTLLVLGVVCTALAHTLFIASLQRMSALVASLVASLEPVWGILFAVVLLGEIPTLRSLIGGGMIVGAALLPALRTPKPL